MVMRKSTTLFFWLMFAAYLFLVGNLFFSRASGISGVNLIPLHSIKSYIDLADGFSVRFVDVNIWGNVLVFIPAGLYVMIFSKGRSFLKGLLAIIGLSIGVEVIQYVCSIGAADVDDVLLNSFGGLIGMISYRLLYKIVKTPERVKQIVAWLSLVVGLPVVGLVAVLYLFNH